VARWRGRGEGGPRIWRAISWEVMKARTRRRAPQGQSKTSKPQVRRRSAAQSRRGGGGGAGVRFNANSSVGEAAAAGGGGGDDSRRPGTTWALPATRGDRRPGGDDLDYRRGAALRRRQVHRPGEERLLVRSFLATQRVLGLDEASAQIFGEGKALLERRGQRLADANLFIGAIAASRASPSRTGSSSL